MKNLIVFITLVLLGMSSCQVNRTFSKHRNLYHKSHARDKSLQEEIQQPVEVNVRQDEEKMEEKVMEKIEISNDSILITSAEIKKENELTLNIPIKHNNKFQNDLHIKREVKKTVLQEKKKSKAMAPAPGIRGEAKERSVLRSVFVSVLIIALSFALIAFLFNTFNPIMVLCFAMLIYWLLMMQIHVGDFDITYGAEQTGYVNGQWVRYQEVKVTY